MDYHISAEAKEILMICLLNSSLLLLHFELDAAMPVNAKL